MKKAFLGLLTGLFLFSLQNPQAQAVETKIFYVYSDKDSGSDSFIPSGWMGDFADLKLDMNSTQNPYSGSTCIKITYKNKASNGARWAGLYWQNPEKNWGSKPNAGFDLTGVKKLTFWAKGKQGGERIEEFKMGGIAGAYPDSTQASIGPVVLTKEWQSYTIDLTGKDLSHVIGGFAWSANLDNNPNGCIFYLDEIKYE